MDWATVGLIAFVVLMTVCVLLIVGFFVYWIVSMIAYWWYVHFGWGFRYWWENGRGR